MTSQPASFRAPPVTHTGAGEPRRVGFELEFTGLTLEQTVEALQQALGGEAFIDSSAEQRLEVEALGSFNIELDWDYLKRTAAEAASGKRDPEWSDLLSQGAHLLVPLEVVCPPIAITELSVLDPMVEKLRQAGAQGTEDSPIAAYGVHINPEISELTAPVIDAYLRAFALLQWWLVKAHELDLTRRISPYIDLYPDAYLKQLLSRSEPDLDQIFSDYLEHNATRNRALDLLPMLAEIDAERVRQVVSDPKIKPRPTFHYRLPNSHVERPGWSLADTWNIWWVVEALAHRPDDLAQLSETFMQHWRPLLGVSRQTWLEYMDSWLKDHGLA